jgi:hypothetical protein
MKFIKVCSLVVAFNIVNSSKADVLANSMIQTPGREVLAGTLKVGDTVYSANDRLKKLGLAKVTAIKKTLTDKYVEIDTGNSVIKAAPDQIFFDTNDREWVKARDITSRNVLMGHDHKGHELVSVMKRRGNHEIVKIDLSPDHVLFNEELVTHNNPAAIAHIVIQGGRIIIGGILAGFGKWIFDITKGKVHKSVTSSHTYKNYNATNQATGWNRGYMTDPKYSDRHVPYPFGQASR